MPLALIHGGVNLAKKAAIHIVGSVRLNQRGRYWQASYTTETGRVRESLKVTNLKVAQKKAREIADLIERGEYATLQDRKINKQQTFADFAEEFKEKHNDWSESTWQACSGMIRLVVEQLGSIPLTAINARMIESFLAMRIDQDEITKATANRYLALFKTMFKKAKRWGYVAHNPAEQIKMAKEEPSIPESLNEEQVGALLSELPAYAQPIAIFALETGMRRGELFRLQWSDIDFKEKWIKVRHAKNNEFRVIPMSDKVHEILCREGEKKSGFYVFAHKDGTPRSSVRHALKNAGTRAEIGHVHLHMLRHTFATRLRDRGVPLDRIKELLGHKTMTMTLRYAKCTPIQLRGAIDCLNESSENQEKFGQEF